MTGEDTAKALRRVYVVSSEATQVLVELEQAGYVPVHVAPRDLLSRVTESRPSAILLDEAHKADLASGRQLAQSLRAHGPAHEVAIVGLLESPTMVDVVRWLEVGATDVWLASKPYEFASKLARLLDECDLAQIPSASLRTRLLAYVERSATSGTLFAYQGTPFEGLAAFIDGQLVDALVNEQQGVDALDQLLAHDASVMSWVDASVVTQPMVKLELPASARRSRVLVVEDIESVALMLKASLTACGYQVDTAFDGREGLVRALETPYDIIVADLNLPLLDGWGLLRLLREDPVGRETAVVVLSAQDELVDQLKAARAGARAYLKKSGRPNELKDTLALVSRPRTVAWQAVSNRTETKVDLRTVGAVWLLRALAELDFTGRLTARDEFSRVEVHVREGQLISSEAQVGSLRVKGHGALECLLGVRAEAFVAPMPVEENPEAPWVFDALRSACDAAVAEGRHQLEALLAEPGALRLNRELAMLFAGMATPRELAVLEALSNEGLVVDTVVRRVHQTADEVKSTVLELVRRGVLATAGSLAW